MMFYHNLIYQYQNTETMVPVFTLEQCDRETWANSVDPDQTAQGSKFDQILHCLPFHHTILVSSSGSQWTCSNFRTDKVGS